MAGPGHNQKIILELTEEEARHLLECSETALHFGLASLSAIQSKKNTIKMVDMIERCKSIRSKLHKEGVKDE